MKDGRKYRVAVVGGAGTWGRHYLKAYLEHPECEVIALVERSKDRRQAFAERYGIKAVFDDVEELLKREIPDIVSAIVPVGVNRDVVIACAEAGVKVVSCEKPIAVRLSDADEMVRICRERGVAFGCGTAHWEIEHLSDLTQWIREGNLGPLTEACMPGGLPVEVSGGGCVPFTFMRLLTGMEADWVEGYVDPPEAEQTDTDCSAYGRLGLSDGVPCEMVRPAPGAWPACRFALEGTKGKVYLMHPKPWILLGKGAAASPTYPKFFENGTAKNAFVSVIERLMRAYDSGGEAQCSGHDYRQALEIAIAIKLSAKLGHKRVNLPLEDRSLRINPSPYREFGGDVAGWEFVGNRKPELI